MEPLRAHSLTVLAETVKAGSGRALIRVLEPHCVVAKDRTTQRRGPAVDGAVAKPMPVLGRQIASRVLTDPILCKAASRPSGSVCKDRGADKGRLLALEARVREERWGPQEGRVDLELMNRGVLRWFAARAQTAEVTAFGLGIRGSPAGGYIPTVVAPVIRRRCTQQPEHLFRQDRCWQRRQNGGSFAVGRRSTRQCGRCWLIGVAYTRRLSRTVLCRRTRRRVQSGRRRRFWKRHEPGHRRNLDRL
jgi:hypothetical protein